MRRSTHLRRGHTVAGGMSRAAEETNRRLLRARDAMDRAYAQPLDVAVAGADRARLRGALHPDVPRDVRRDAAPLPAAPPGRARDVPAARDRPQRHRDLPRRRLQQPGHVQPHVPRRSSASRRPPTARASPPAAPSRPASRWRGPRPSSFGEADRARAASSVALHARTRSPTPTIYVLDQDEALDFYVGKLGLEVHTDADLGFMRWLTVTVPDDPDREIAARAARGRPRSTRRPPSRSASWSRRARWRRRHLRDRRLPRPTRRWAPRASSSPRSRSSASTASTARCATRSATRSASPSRRPGPIEVPPPGEM